jgi:hypothetical protein
MVKNVHHLGKTLDLKSGTAGARKRMLSMVVAYAHRWVSGWGATGSDGAMEGLRLAAAARVGRRRKMRSESGL